MATWGEFINDIAVVRKPGGMFVVVDDVITLWDERNALRSQVAELQAALSAAREACAQEVEEFAEACAAEVDAPEVALVVLRAAARMLREPEPTEEEAPETETE